MDLLEYLIDSTEKGLNLGSECPQIFAIFYLSGLDNWLKTVKRVKYYGRYMDDIFIFSPSKEYLKSLLIEIKSKLSELKLEANDKKTHISRISDGFTFLQIKYGISRGIFKRPTRKKIVRERRRLKVFKGKMTANEIYNCYKSWKCAVLKDSPCCKKSMASLDYLFNSLYSLTKTEKPTRTKLYKQITKEINYDDCRYIWENCYKPRLF
jgi:Reverse transcriptase (RNA-dependent DNA polymerase).